MSLTRNGNDGSTQGARAERRRFGLGRPARIGGAATFLLFEAFGGFAAYLLASLRCCGAGGPAGPRDAGEWIALVLLVLVMVLLGSVLAGGVALAIEGVHRLAARAWRRR